MVASKTSPPIAPGVGPLQRRVKKHEHRTSCIPHDTTKAASSESWRELLSPRSSRRFHSLAYSASQHSFEKAICATTVAPTLLYCIFHPQTQSLSHFIGPLINAPTPVWKNRVRSSTVPRSCHLQLFDSLYRYITATVLSCRIL
jgi:hypothetical protein